VELIPEEVLIAVLAECVPEHVRRDARVGDIGETIIRVFMLHLRAEAASGGSPAVLGSLLAGACTSKTLRPEVKSLPGAAMGRTPPLLLQRNSTSPKGRKQPSRPWLADPVAGWRLLAESGHVAEDRAPRRMSGPVRSPLGRNAPAPLRLLSLRRDSVGARPRGSEWSRSGGSVGPAKTRSASSACSRRTGLSERLKIRVSLVGFRPWPPFPTR
jgi:hypothetical protein